MRIDEPFLQPSSNRPPLFDGMHEELATLTIQCHGCGRHLQQNVLSFVSVAGQWFRELPTNDREEIVRTFGCEVSEYDGHPIVRAHGGGQPYFGPVLCGDCSTIHLIYLNFFEKQPARYVAVLQGAARIEV
ncbi:hypothetical protein DyAD56_07940 [Dyella sp. AD56]|uniref:hypothetical protein n=1 Tax=Dyella sp. AD56 TaxID=1528744 RepID=UPI000C853A01|nr:hypothetical protein [Dyella sp. AD56]PMQ05711.1 hypothetical protein DyAD56_07940 [Dyella sp. AD56]